MWAVRHRLHLRRGGARGLRPARGWQEALDGLLIVVVVTMAILYVNGASPLSTGLPDGIEIIVIVVAVISNASLVLTVGGLVANREGIVGPVLAIATAGIATAYVVLVNLMAPVSPVGVGAAAAVTVLTAWLWVAAAHLRLRRHRTVQIVPRKHRPSMWRELLPAVLLSALVMLVFFTGGVGSLIGALVAAGLVAARMTLTLIQYRRLLDEEHARLAAHERTLIEERYTRFAMEETQSELVEDNERLRGQESDRLGVIQLLQESVLVPTRELRSELARTATTRTRSHGYRRSASPGCARGPTTSCGHSTTS